MDSIQNLIKTIDVDENIKNHIVETEREFIKYVSALSETEPYFQEVFLDTLKEEEIVNTNSFEGEKDFNTAFMLNVKGMMTAIDEMAKYLKTGLLNEEQLKNVHRSLLLGTNSINKMPGEYRNRQVWVGNYGEGIEHALYIPPAPEDIKPLMEKFLEFFNENEINNDPLSHPFIKSAIIHARFVNIHPFVDGNGRIARFLHYGKLWQLTAKKYNFNFEFPCLYLSKNLSLYKLEYFKRLKNLNNPSDESWNKWFEFILNRMDDQLFYLNSNLENTYQNYKDSMKRG